MDLARLCYMADQIARNFAAIGHDHAASATADHIVRFWEPRMKTALLAADPAALSPIARDAVGLLAKGCQPPTQTRAAAFDDVAEGGRSDAG